MSEHSTRHNKASAAAESTVAITAYDRLADKLRAQIIAGELMPGDRLPAEPELSSAYDVSRNTAREALRTLASQGFVRAKRGTSGGTFVAHPSALQVSESLQTSLALLTESAHLPISSLLEVREMLEVPAVELAALRRTTDELDLLQQSLYDPQAIDGRRLYAHNQAFHSILFKASHNPLIELVAEPVFSVLQSRINRDDTTLDFRQRVDHEHREIFGYIASQDQAGAREAARAHLRTLRQDYVGMDKESVARS